MYIYIKFKFIYDLSDSSFLLNFRFFVKSQYIPSSSFSSGNSFLFCFFVRFSDRCHFFLPHASKRDLQNVSLL